jgi:Hint domain-containing protein
MATTVINTYATTTADLSGNGNDLLVTSSGSIVIPAGADGVDSTGDDQGITIDGLVYSSADAVVISGTSTTLFVGGEVQGGDTGVFVDEGTGDFVNVGSQGQIDGVSGGFGVYFVGDNAATSDSLNNAGDISTSFTAVEVDAGGDDLIINSGQISGTDGILFQNNVATETVENSGTIEGGSASTASAITSYDSSAGVNVVNSGLLTDGSTNAIGTAEALLFFNDDPGSKSTIDNTGTIIGLGYVIQSTLDALTISNSGTIDGGLYAENSAEVDNSALWQGPLVFFDSENTLTNSQSGTLEGAINFDGDGDTVDNAGNVDGAITLQAGNDQFTNAGAIDGAVTFTGAGITNTFTNTGSITGDFTFSGADSTLTNDGHIYGNVTLADPDTLNNTGIIDGNVTLGAGDTFGDSQGGAVTGPITASSSNLFEFSGHFGNETIANFTGGAGSTHDTIQFAADDFASFMAVQNAMSQVGPDVVITLDSTDSITLENVTLSNLVSADFQFVCFMAGTMISTPRGEAAIQMLRRGDIVMTADNRIAAISWIGRQTVATRFADPVRCLPIRIRASALGDDVPSRDLLVSPDHAILVDDVLIQAGALINGTSIVRETNVPETFIYYHVELDDHSLILAENTPAESFVDNVDRARFDNWYEYEEQYPQGKPVVEMPYPRAKAHRQVPRAIRQRLATRGAALYGLVAFAA